MNEKLRYIHKCSECASNCELTSTNWPDGYLDDKLCMGSKWVKTEIPKHETVEQWEKRTGETYPDDGPVWCWSSEWGGEWGLLTYHYSKKFNTKTYVATHHGKPVDL